MIPAFVRRNDTIIRLVLRKVGQLTCAHNWALVQSPSRLFLRCPTCGAESPGIAFDAPDARSER